MLCSVRSDSTVVLTFIMIIDTTTEFSTLSLHDALPIYLLVGVGLDVAVADALGVLAQPEALRRQHDLRQRRATLARRSEEHTSELQSPCNLVCRLLLAKKNKQTYHTTTLSTFTA